MDTLLIYTPRTTPRVEYIFNFIFHSLLGISYEATTSREVFFSSDMPVMSYAKHPVDKGVWIHSHELLFETGIEPVDPKTGMWNDLPALFFTGPGPDLPFDLFAASFYLITRYEEYLDFPKDAFRRFPAKASIAYREQFLDIPLIDRWVRKLGRILKVRYPELEIAPPAFTFLSTIDVDQAWAYRHKGILRHLMGGTADLFQGRFADLSRRMASEISADPYGSYDYLKEVHQTCDLKPVFFFQVGKYGTHDKNISGRHPSMRKLVRKTGDYAHIGLHPSVRSGERRELDSELVLLSGILGEKIRKSRQHYLKLSFPDTYKTLNRFGIEEDFTLGYSDAIGFRASTATPFRFYNLESNQETGLFLVPFQVMDVTLKNQLGLSPDQAIERLSLLIEEIKKVGGNFVSVWHNSSLHDRGEWAGWKRVFEEMLRMGTDG